MLFRVKHVNQIRAKGRIYYYHRKTGERLPDEPNAAAKRASEINAQLAAKDKTPDGGSFAALIADYRKSPEFQNKAAKTREEYNRYLRWFEDHYAADMVGELDAEWVWDLRDTFADTPRKADFMVQVLSILCQHAMRKPRRYGLTENPCKGVKKVAKGTPIPPWPDNVIRDALKHAYPELRWLIVFGLYLGQRGQDDIRLLWSHYDGQTIRVTQAKTGKPLVIPVHPTLKAVIDSIPRKNAVILTTQTGRPWTTNHLRHEFHWLMREKIEWPGYSRHGLRKNAVNNLLEAGCSTAQVAAITGQTWQMVEHYAAGRDQERLARQAIQKLIENGTP